MNAIPVPSGSTDLGVGSCRPRRLLYPAGPRPRFRSRSFPSTTRGLMRRILCFVALVAAVVAAPLAAQAAPPSPGGPPDVPPGLGRALGIVAPFLHAATGVSG